MNLQQLLNADVRTIGRWAQLGLSWWGQELLALLPARLRDRPRRRATWTAVLSDQGGVSLWRDGAPAGPAERVGGSIRTADLVLPPHEALVRELDLPRLSDADLRRLVALNLDRFTPFAADQVYFDLAVLDRTALGVRQGVRLGVLRRDRAHALMAQASQRGVQVKRMGPGGGPDGRELQLDFARAMREQDGVVSAVPRRVYLWSACGLLAGAAVLLATLSDAQDIDRLQRLVDAQQPTVSLAEKLRRSVQAERNRRIELLTRRSAHEPLRILDAATRALPRGEWVQRMEWNGRVVRLVGFKQPGFDVPAALTGPALVNVRSLLSDMPTRTADGREPFDVMADTANGRRR